MAIRTVAEKNSLATKYGVDSPFGTMFTADPGITGAATGEVTGGTPAFARKAINWGAPSNGVITGTATFDIPTGATLTYSGVCVSSVLATADVRDSTTVPSQNYASQGTYLATFTFTQT